MRGREKKVSLLERTLPGRKEECQIEEKKVEVAGEMRGMKGDIEGD